MTLGCRDGFVTIAADDFEHLVMFYQRLLARSPEVLIPQVYAEFKLPGVRLGIFKPKDSEEFSASDRSGMSLCLEVADLEAAIAHASQVSGAVLSKMTSASHGRELYLYDPVGNRLILHQSVP
ncbi:MAG: VOC family protein [Cyanobacteria bacterium P01_A01_bin.123]